MVCIIATTLTIISSIMAIVLLNQLKRERDARERTYSLLRTVCDWAISLAREANDINGLVQLKEAIENEIEQHETDIKPNI